MGYRNLADSARLLPYIMTVLLDQAQTLISILTLATHVVVIDQTLVVQVSKRPTYMVIYKTIKSSDTVGKYSVVRRSMPRR